MTFRALRLILVQKALDAGFVELLGYSPEPALIALHKLDLAQEVLNMTRIVPFEAIKANGESMVRPRTTLAQKLMLITQAGRENQASRRLPLGAFAECIYSSRGLPRYNRLSGNLGCPCESRFTSIRCFGSTDV